MASKKESNGRFFLNFANILELVYMVKKSRVLLLQFLRNPPPPTTTTQGSSQGVALSTQLTVTVTVHVFCKTLLVYRLVGDVADHTQISSELNTVCFHLPTDVSPFQLPLWCCPSCPCVLASYFCGFRLPYFFISIPDLNCLIFSVECLHMRTCP